MVSIRNFIHAVKGEYKNTRGLWCDQKGIPICSKKALKEYIRKREQYPLPFTYYKIVHKDGNLENDNRRNLLILTESEEQYRNKVIAGRYLNNEMEIEI